MTHPGGIPLRARAALLVVCLIAAWMGALVHHHAVSRAPGLEPHCELCASLPTALPELAAAIPTPVRHDLGAVAAPARRSVAVPSRESGLGRAPPASVARPSY